MADSGDLRVYESRAFAGATKAARLNAGITQAVIDGYPTFMVAQKDLPFDASTITFNSAVRMTREGNLPNVYDVKAYGAAGDGATTDDAAFSAVTTNAPAGSTIYVPSVSTFYKLANGEWLLNVAGLTVIGDGYGSQIKQTSAVANNVLHITAAKTTVRGLRLIGSGVHTGASTQQNVVLVDAADDVTIQQNWIENGSLTGVQLITTCKRSRVLYNVITGTNTDAFQTNSSDIYCLPSAMEDTLIQGNQCLSANKNQGIFIQIGQQGGATDYDRRCQIVNNWVTTSAQTGGTQGHGIAVYISVNGATTLDPLIAYNHIRDCQGIGIYLKGLVANPGLIQSAAIIGNHLVNCVTVGTGGSLEDACIASTYDAGAVISGNTIHDGGVANASAIRADGGTGASIVGNTIVSWSRDGIKMTGGVAPTRGKIIGNMIDGTNIAILVQGTGHRIIGNTVNAATTSGCKVDSTAVDVLVEGNDIENVPGSGHGLDVIAGALRTHLIDNNLWNNTAPISEGGTGTVRRMNRLSTGAMNGTATLAAANPAATVTTVEVQTGDKILLSRHTAGGTLGHLSIGTITNGTSFTIVASGNLDTSTVDWEIVH